MRTPPLALLAAMLLLAGCAPTTTTPQRTTPTVTETPLTAESTRKAALDLFDATKKLVSKGDWRVDGYGYDGCHRPDGSMGAEYTRQEGTIPGPNDPKAVAEAVAALWESRGYHGVTIKHASDDDYDVTYPKDENRVLLTLGMTTLGASMLISAGCVPGDSSKLTDALYE